MSLIQVTLELWSLDIHLSPYANSNSNFSEDGTTTFEKCKSYDVSGWGTINEDFNSALTSRPDNYADTTIACQAYTYNKSEGLDTIVNDVRWNFFFDSEIANLFLNLFF